MRARAALLGAVLFLLPGAPRAERSPFAPGEVEAMSREQLAARQRDAEARFARQIEASEAAQRDYTAHPGQAAFDAWRGALGPCFPIIGELEALAREQNDRVRKNDSAVMSALASTFMSGKAVPPSPPGGPSLRTERDLAKERELRLLRRFWDQGDAFGPVERRRAEEAKRFQLLKSAAPWGGAACVLLALIGWLWWREHRRLAALPAAVTGMPEVLLGGNYRVGALVGRGAMGEVFEGVDVTLNRRVALKRLRPELARSPADLEPLLAEARLVAALQHPNIVAIHAVERHGPEVYLVLEFVDGETLDARLARDGRLPWPEALALFRGCCTALAYAHARRVVHRDVKPANIMLTKDGAPKLADFGIAHVARGAAARMTRAAAFGTPPYMAPEQELGTVHAGVDLFALSACLYEAVTGRQAFTGPNFLAQKQEGVYAPPRSLAPDLPAGADAFFARAFAPEPARRFKDADELAAAAGSLG